VLSLKTLIFPELLPPKKSQLELEPQGVLHSNKKRKNPLTNVIAMNKLNPYAAIVRRRTQKLREIQSKRQAKVHQKRIKPKYSRKEFLKVLHTPSIAPARSAAEIGILATGEDK